MVMVDLLICLIVFNKISTISLKEAFCINPPIKEAININIPGVVNHTKVYGLAPTPVYILTDVLTSLNLLYKPGNKGLIPIIMTNININGEKATKILFNSNFSSLFVSSLCL